VTGADVKGKGAAEEWEGVAVVSVSGSRLGVAVSGEPEGLQTWPLTVGCSEVGRRDGSREGALVTGRSDGLVVGVAVVGSVGKLVGALVVGVVGFRVGARLGTTEGCVGEEVGAWLEGDVVGMLVGKVGADVGATVVAFCQTCYFRKTNIKSHIQTIICVNIHCELGFLQKIDR
jgi:hypothetical protein